MLLFLRNGFQFGLLQSLLIIGLLLVAGCAPGDESLHTAVPTEPTGPTFTNPVYKHDFPDPHVLLVGDTYYAYATHGNASNIRVISSTDLVNWVSQGDALPALPRWSVLNSGFTWAPGVIQIEDSFLMYYTARDKESDRQCISVGVSANPTGAFLDHADVPMICQEERGGSIDPYPFRDEDDRLYLLWKNDGNCCGYDIWLWIQELSADGMSLRGEPLRLLQMDQAWERPLIENPAMVKHEGRYFLFYSGNWWESHEYAISYAVCESTTGPCEKPLSEPWLQYSPPVMGPGGQAFFTDINGNLWMAYHAWTGADVGYPGGKRTLRIDRISFENGKPVTDGPTHTPQSLP